MRHISRTILFAFVVFLLSATALTLNASMLDRHLAKDNENTLLYADEIIHEKETGTITARGHVEIEREGRVLRADVVTYNDKTDIMTASGHVRLDEPSGEIIYVDYAELTGDLKTGFVNRVRMTLSDNARFVANRGERKNAHTSHFDHAVYSPCNLCKVNPQNPPFWQVKAKHVVFDEKAQDIYYTDALIEMFGIPTFYTPYLRHPAPNVKRRSGLLSLTMNQSTALGWFGIMEYFWVISQDKDITLTPMIRGNGNGVLAVQYRQRLEKGQFSFDGSIDPGAKVVDNKGNTLKESHRVRWHIAPEGKYNFTEHIRGGFRVERVSDQTYLRRYSHLGLSGRTFLTSNVYGEGFWGRSYASVQNYAFQGLREGDKNATTPFLLPWITVHYLGKPDSWGGRWSLDGDGLVLTRQEGTRYGRLSATSGWQKPYVSTWGDMYTIGAKLRTDLYEVHNYNPPNNLTKYNANIFRVFPQAYATWNYPFFRQWRSYRVVLEPVMGIVGAPNLSQPTKLPNEDSLFIEFNDTDVMSESRFAGLDRIDGGSRFNYGVNLAGFSGETGNTGLFVGQSLAFQDPGQYLDKTGLDKRLSDVVARLKYNYKGWLHFKTRFLLDRTTFHFHRNETNASIGKPILRFSTDYIHLPILKKNPDDDSRKQIRLTLSSDFLDNWSASITTTRNMGKRSQTLSQGISLTYHNECFTFTNTLTKKFYSDRDLSPGLIYMFRISFKNLGEFSQSFGVLNEPGSNVQAF